MSQSNGKRKAAVFARRLRGRKPELSPMSAKRARWAAAAIAGFVKVCGTDRDDEFCDLLCDLMHLARERGVNFDHELERAHLHYASETSQACVQCGTLYDREEEGYGARGQLCPRCGNPEYKGTRNARRVGR